MILSEREVAAFFVGEKVHLRRLALLESDRHQGSGNYHDCVESIINLSSLCQSNDKTAHLYPASKAIDLKLLLYLNEDFIKGIRIMKYKTILYPDGVSSGYEIDPNPNDIALVEKILTYIVKEEGRNSHENHSYREQIQNIR